MSYSVEPRLHPVAIADLRPTQITVGMREVEMKRIRWRAEREEKGADFLGRHAVPVVIGSKRRLYLIDHHHLALALHLEGEQEVLITVVADLSRLGKDEFWSVLDNRSWMHPLDAESGRRGHEEIPRKVSSLVDDPYRSLAGAAARRRLCQDRGAVQRVPLGRFPAPTRQARPRQALLSQGATDGA